jgi:aryl-alcohol dehydrogenase-like predicted oxidoreductase
MAPPPAPLDRKQFLRVMAGAAAGLACAPLLRSGQEPAAEPQPATPKMGDPLPKRRLGREGPELTILGMGGSHMAMAPDEKASRELVEAALAKGVRFFDNAESYENGKAERWMGAALKSVRKDVFLMTKTLAPDRRNAESAKLQLAGSLERLQTDYLDLWQFHSVKTPEDVDLGFREGGALEYMLEMKRQKVVRWIGVTGHALPAANLRALHWWDQGWKFDSMQMPINPVDFHQSSFQKEVLPELVKRGIGVIAMKTSASGRLHDDGLCTVDECQRFVWSLPVSTAVVGMRTVAEVKENALRARTAAAAADVPPMAVEEADRLLARLQPQAKLELEWYKAKV